MRCLTGARFTMLATVLRQTSDYEEPLDPNQEGTWVDSQNPLTGEIVRIWQPIEDVPDNPDTVEIDPKYQTIPCMARGIVDGGIRVAGTTERFGDSYENIDYVKLWTPSYVFLTKRDRITNIRTANGTIVWVDEEYDATRATVFNVNGVTPLFDGPFNRHTENFVLLQRAEVS